MRHLHCSELQAPPPVDRCGDRACRTCGLPSLAAEGRRPDAAHVAVDNSTSREQTNMNKPLAADRIYAARRAHVRASAAADLPALLASVREAAGAKSLNVDALASTGDALSAWREANASDPMSETALAIAVLARDPHDRGIDAKKHETTIRAAVLAALDLAAVAGKPAR